MSADRFRLVCEAFEAARIVPPGERDAVVERACGGDEALAAEVHELLRHHGTVGDGLDEATDGAALPQAGDLLDQYRVLERLGEGGMGVVFLAEAPDGPTVSALRRWAAERGGWLVGGFPERDGERLFNSTALAGPDGTTWIYRKIHLFNREKLIFTPGDRPHEDRKLKTKNISTNLN